VNCPGHAQIFARMSASYRDLPVRFAEIGLCHRRERSGSLLGLMRLNQFSQDDGHIFCEQQRIADEIARFCRSLRALYAELGFDHVQIGLSSRPDDRAGEDSVWDRAEALLEAAAREVGLSFEHQPGQGAFYGPKLDFSLQDRRGRVWQCGSIQLDLVLPDRFDLNYVDASGGRQRPVMLHRALLGSFERFLAILLEHHRGALPVWLAPEQIVVAPIAQAQAEWAGEVVARLKDAGARASLDARNESLARRLVDAHAAGVPLFCAVGKREVERRSVSVRERDGSQRDLPLDEAIVELARRCRPPVS
jgi:threonyl-tRNA synthetase